MGKATAKSKKPAPKAPAKKIANKPTKKPGAKVAVKEISKKIAAKPIAKPAVKQNTKVMAKEVAKKPVPKITAKVAPKISTTMPKKTVEVTKVVAKPVKVVKQPVVKEDKKKLAKAEKELKLKGKKSKSSDGFEDEVEVSSSRRNEDEDDDDLFSEKKNSKTKNLSNDRLKKEADLPTEKMFNLADYFLWSDVQASLENLNFFLPKDDACMERLCENIRTTGPYCRLHYIANWKLMQQKKEILKGGKLQTLIEDFVTKYPANFIQAILDDLDSDREFHRVLTELNISDTEFDAEEVAVAVEDEDDDTIDFESRSMDTFKPGGFEEE